MFKNPGDYEQLCCILNYQFIRKELLAQAITTKSAFNKRLQSSLIGHQEALAFFGDSLLRMVVDNLLMKEFPFFTVGELSNARALLVKNATLIEVAKKLELEKFIIMDDEQSRQCKIGTPKLLADTVEAIICAIYQDSTNNLTEVSQFILSHSKIGEILKKYREEEQEKHIPLIKAIQTGDVQEVKALLDRGFSVNFLFQHIEYIIRESYHSDYAIPQEHSLTPLGFALHCVEKIARNDADVKPMLAIIECLLQYGANPNLHAKKNSSSLLVLFSPISYDGGVADATMFEISHTLPSDPAFSISNTIAEHSVRGWEAATDQIVALLCQYGAQFDVDNDATYSYLGLTIVFKKYTKMDLLLKHHVDPNFIVKNGRAPLHLASALSDEIALTKLLQAKADPNQTDKEGNCPFDVATSTTCKKLLLAAEITRSPLPAKQENMAELNAEAVKCYNEASENNFAAPLTKAIQLFTRILTFQLSNRDLHDKELVTNYYNLGSAYLKRRQYNKAKRYLDRTYHLYLINEHRFQQKTDKFLHRLTECETFLSQHKGKDPFERIRASHHQPEMKASQETETGLNKLNRELFAAINSYHAASVLSLLKKGADPDSRSPTGEPALHSAIQTYTTAVLMAQSVADIPECELSTGRFPGEVLASIDSLLEYGADPNQCDEHNQTALHAAAIANSPQIVMKLLAYGAKADVSDVNNKYPSHYATDSWTRSLILKSLLPKEIRQERAARRMAHVDNIHSSSQQEIDEQPKEMPVTHKPATPTHSSLKQPKEERKSSSISQHLPLTTQPNSSQPILAVSTHKKTSTAKLCHFYKPNKPNSCKKGNQCDFRHEDPVKRNSFF